MDKLSISHSVEVMRSSSTAYRPTPERPRRRARSHSLSYTDQASVSKPVAARISPTTSKAFARSLYHSDGTVERFRNMGPFPTNFVTPSKKTSKCPRASFGFPLIRCAQPALFWLLYRSCCETLFASEDAMHWPGPPARRSYPRGYRLALGQHTSQQGLGKT